MLSFYHKMQSVAQIPYENCVLEKIRKADFYEKIG